MQNGHTSGNEREVWMERVNFDGHVTGETARALILAAEAAKVTPQELVGELLNRALVTSGVATTKDRANRDTTVEPMTINAGNAGFHVVTVVADGYGSLIAENSAGEELAKVKVQRDDDIDGAVIDPTDDLKRLMDAFGATDRRS